MSRGGNYGSGGAQKSVTDAVASGRKSSGQTLPCQQNPASAAASTESKEAPNPRVKIREEVERVLSAHREEILKLDPNAKIGYRGSLATGIKFKSQTPFDPGNFDVDAFIVSDAIAGKYPPRVQWRSGEQHRNLSPLQSTIDKELRAKPEMKGMRKGEKEKFNFRIFTTREMARIEKAGEKPVFIAK